MSVDRPQSEDTIATKKLTEKMSAAIANIETINDFVKLNELSVALNAAAKEILPEASVSASLPTYQATLASYKKIIAIRKEDIIISKLPDVNGMREILNNESETPEDLSSLLNNAINVTHAWLVAVTNPHDNLEQLKEDFKNLQSAFTAKITSMQEQQRQAELEAKRNAVVAPVIKKDSTHVADDELIKKIQTPNKKVRVAEYLQAELRKKMDEQVASGASPNIGDKVISYAHTKLHEYTTRPGEFTAEKAKNLDSTLNTSSTLVAAKFVGSKLRDGIEYGKMMEHFIAKGKAGEAIATELIRDHLANLSNPVTPKQSDILNRCLMSAARIGDKILYEEVVAKGGRFVDDNKNLILDENSFNVLHYACQGGNPILVHQIAESMRTLEKQKGLIPPEDSVRNGQFDPFRIRDDKSGDRLNRIGSYAQINELRPIHFISAALARGLDEKYNLGADGAPGTFTAAYNLFRIENRVLAKGNLDWANQKQGSFGEEVSETALKGKGFASVIVANYTDKIQSMVLGNIGAGVAITAVAAGFALHAAYQKKGAKALAKLALGAYEFVSLPTVGPNPEPQAIQGDYASGILRDKNHNLIEALTIRDYKKAYQIITKDPLDFKETTTELIQIVRQISQMSSLDPAINTKLEDFMNFKEKLYDALAEKIDYTSFRDKTVIKKVDELLDSLYNTDTKKDNALGKTIVAKIQAQLKKNNKETGDIGRAVEGWSEKFAAQDAELKLGKVERAEFPEVHSNHELIEAIEKCDFYKMRHLIAHGEFNYTSKEVMHALEHMYVFPLDLATNPDLKGDVRNQPLIDFVFEGLAKNAGPKEFMHVLSHLINTRGQVDVGKRVIANLIARYDRDPKMENGNTAAADIERLKICAVLAAGLGEKEQMQKALHALQDRHGLSTLQVMDEKGNNILHYAAQSQNGDMIQYIMKETTMIEDFNLANKTVQAPVIKEGMIHDLATWGKHKLFSENALKKRERAFHEASGKTVNLSSIQKADNIFQIANREGKTAFRMVNKKELLESMDAFAGGTVGFRQEANEVRQRQRDTNESRAATASQAGILVAMLAASCVAIIPGAIGLGTTIGLAVASKVGLGAVLPGFTITGSVFEGATAVGLALGTEHGLLPAFGKLGKSIYDYWGKAFNGTSMDTLPDYDDRIMTKSNQITAIIANKLAETGVTKYEDILDLINQETRFFIEAESDPTMKELTRLATVNAAMSFATPKNVDPLVPLSKEDLAVQMKEMIYSAAAKSEMRAGVGNAVNSFNAMVGRLNTAIDKLAQSTFVLNKDMKIHQKINKLMTAISRIKEDYVTTEDINLLAEGPPPRPRDDCFLEAAIAKANADFQRQAILITNDGRPWSEEKRAADIKSLEKRLEEKMAFIQNIDQAYKDASQRHEHSNAVIFSKDGGGKDIIIEVFRTSLANIEGGTLQYGPLTKALDDISFENNKPDRATIAKALTEAFENVEHKTPAKAIQLQKAIDLFIETYDKMLSANPSQTVDADRTVDAHADSTSSVDIDVDDDDDLSLDGDEFSPHDDRAAYATTDDDDEELNGDDELIASMNNANPALTLGRATPIGPHHTSQEQILDETEHHAMMAMMIPYVREALNSYHYDHYARQTLANLHVITNGTRGPSISEHWKSHLHMDHIPPILNPDIQAALDSKRTLIEIPKGLTRVNAALSDVIVEHDNKQLATLPKKATYVHDSSGAKFDVHASPAGNSYNFKTDKAPPLASMLAFANEQLKLYIKHNGTNHPIEIGGGNRDLVRNMLLVCKANNIEAINTSQFPMTMTTADGLSACQAQNIAPIQLTKVSLQGQIVPERLKDTAKRITDGSILNRPELHTIAHHIDTKAKQPLVAAQAVHHQHRVK